MQYLVISTPKQKFGTDEIPSDFLQLLLEEEAQAKALYCNDLTHQLSLSASRLIRELLSFCNTTLRNAPSLELMAMIWVQFAGVTGLFPQVVLKVLRF